MQPRSLLILCAAVLSVQFARADVLFDQSNITTGIGNGLNGANTSAIASNSGSFGYTDNNSVNFQIADDFTLSAQSLISSIVFYSYSTSTYPSPPTSPFTGATLNIWNAQPGTPGAAVIFSSSTLAMTAWTGVYRVQPTALTNAQRPVFSVTMSFSNISLAAGTYWAAWTADVGAPGNPASVFNPPFMNMDGTQPVGNSLQSSDGGATWLSTLDNAGAGPQVALPLLVNGIAVPEPSTTALMLLVVSGVAGFKVFRRQRG